MAKTKIQENQLLTSDERAACEGFASGDPPHSQRATALLALDSGATQMQAAGQAGLTKGQVRYWLDKFRQERLAIFPEESLASPQPEPVSELHATKGPELPVPSREVSQPPKPDGQPQALIDSPTPADSLEVETEEKAGPAEETKKAKKGKKGSKKKAKKSQPDKGSQKKSKTSKKKKAKKKDGKKAKKDKKDKKAGNKKKSPGDKKKS